MKPARVNTESYLYISCSAAFILKTQDEAHSRDEMRWGKKEKSPQDTLSNEDPGGGWMLSLLFHNNPSSSKHCRVNVEVPSSFTLSQYEKVSLSREILTQGIIDKPVYALCRWRKSSLVLFQKGSAAMLP